VSAQTILSTSMRRQQNDCDVKRGLNKDEKPKTAHQGNENCDSRLRSRWLIS